MTAEEREAWLDHLAESGDPPGPDEDEEDVEPLTAEELAEVRRPRPMRCSRRRRP